jgi:hypothetical protein
LGQRFAVVLTAQFGEVLGGRHGASSLIIGDFVPARAAPEPPPGAPVGGSVARATPVGARSGRSRGGGSGPARLPPRFSSRPTNRATMLTRPSQTEHNLHTMPAGMRYICSMEKAAITGD